MEISSSDVLVEEVQLKVVRSGMSLAPLAFLRQEEGASEALSVADPLRRQDESAGGASSSTGDEGWWYNKPQYDLFPDEKTKNAFNFYLRRRQINLWVLVPFMAITLAVAPVVLPREVFRGTYGSRYQIASAGIVCQMALQYVLLGLECCSEQIATYFRVSLDTVKLCREWVMIAYCLFSPVGHGAILFFRSTGPACSPTATILETNFCRASAHDDISIPNFVCLMVYTLFYQVLFPIPWRYHFLAWVIGFLFVALSIAAVYEATHVEFGGHFVLYVMIYFSSGLLQAYFQFTRVGKFLVSPRRPSSSSLPTTGQDVLYSSVSAPKVARPQDDLPTGNEVSSVSSLPPPPPPLPPSLASSSDWTGGRKMMTSSPYPYGREKSDSIISELTEATL